MNRWPKMTACPIPIQLKPYGPWWIDLRLVWRTRLGSFMLSWASWRSRSRWSSANNKSPASASHSMSFNTTRQWLFAPWNTSRLQQIAWPTWTWPSSERPCLWRIWQKSARYSFFVWFSFLTRHFSQNNMKWCCICLQIARFPNRCFVSNPWANFICFLEFHPRDRFQQLGRAVGARPRYPQLHMLRVLPPPLGDPRTAARAVQSFRAGAESQRGPRETPRLRGVCEYPCGSICGSKNEQVLLGRPISLSVLPLSSSSWFVATRCCRCGCCCYHYVFCVCFLVPSVLRFYWCIYRFPPLLERKLFFLCLCLGVFLLLWCFFFDSVEKKPPPHWKPKENKNSFLFVVPIMVFFSFHEFYFLLLFSVPLYFLIWLFIRDISCPAPHPNWRQSLHTRDSPKKNPHVL